MLISHIVIFVVCLSGYSLGILLCNISNGVFPQVPCVSLVIQRIRVGFPHSYAYILCSALEIMSLYQTSLFFFQCIVLVPITVGFYIGSNPTILK